MPLVPLGLPNFCVGKRRQSDAGAVSRAEVSGEMIPHDKRAPVIPETFLGGFASTSANTLVGFHPASGITDADFMDP